MTPWVVHNYPLARYPFPERVAYTLGVEDLTALSSDAARRTWQTDQQSPWHAPFYDGFTSWCAVYTRFVSEWIAQLFDEPFYYQRVPTFRVHQPGNVAVGEVHTDAQYHHPLGEETFWLPLTEAHGSASLWVEDDSGELRCVNARPGELIQFSAVTRRHGNQVNETGRSRASFDFRCLPVRFLPEEPGRTEHTQLEFAPGGYYAVEPCG